MPDKKLQEGHVPARPPKKPLERKGFVPPKPPKKPSGDEASSETESK